MYIIVGVNTRKTKEFKGIGDAPPFLPRYRRYLSLREGSETGQIWSATVVAAQRRPRVAPPDSGASFSNSTT